MQAGTTKHPYRIAALAGAALFFCFGVIEAVYLLFFQGAMIQLGGMTDWVMPISKSHLGGRQSKPYVVRLILVLST